MAAKLLLALATAAFLAPAAAEGTIDAPLSEFKFTNPMGEATETVGHSEGDGRVFFYTTGVAKQTVKAPADGDYTLVLELACDEANKMLAKLKLTVNDKVVKPDFALTQADKKDYKFEVKLKKGDNTFSVEFLNDEYKESEYDLNLYIHGAKFEPKKK